MIWNSEMPLMYEMHVSVHENDYFGHEVRISKKLLAIFQSF